MPVGIGILIGVTVGGIVMDVIGKIKAGNAAKNIGDYNAAQYELQAQDAIQRGGADEEKFRAGVKTLIGGQRAGFAGQNVDIGQGTPVDVVSDTAFLGELDALTIRQNAQREAHGYQAMAENARLGGDAAKSAAYWSAGATALGGAGSLLAARYGWGRSTTRGGTNLGNSSSGVGDFNNYAQVTG
jgi:hypothetical protein